MGHCHGNAPTDNFRMNGKELKMNLEHIKPKDFKPIAIKSYCRFHNLVIFIFLAVFTIPAFAYGVTSDDFNTCVINE